MAAHIFVMSAVLTVQACVAAGFYVDTSWQDQLPQEEEAIKEWLEARLEVRGGSSSPSVHAGWVDTYTSSCCVSGTLQ
jgi:predicted metal-dependent phosphotriesterase family hydrolase